MLLSAWRTLGQPGWRMLVLLTGVLLLFTWRCWFLYQMAQIPYLLVPVYTPLTGQAQLYYDRGYGLNEHDSVLRNVEKNRQKLWGVIPWLVPWVGRQGQFYLFQLPLFPVHAFMLESRGNLGTMQIGDAAVVNGLGNFIRAIDEQRWQPIDTVISSSLRKPEGFAVVDNEKGNPQAGIVFDPPLLLDQCSFFRVTDFFIRGLGEFLFLFAVVISLNKFANFILSFSFVQSAVKKISCLSNPVVQNKIAFIVFTIIFLWFYTPLAERWFPLLFEKSLFCIFIILTIRHFFIRDDKSNVLYFSLLFFLLLVVISALMHLYSVSAIDANNYISITNYNFHGILFDKYGWSKLITDKTSLYLFFISLFFISSVSFYSKIHNAWKMLLWIPVINFPGLLVALYQVHIDKNFFYNDDLKFDELCSGLSGDYVSFRILLFLIFPLYVFAAIIAKKWWKRILLILPVIIILWLAKLTSGRAAISGIIGFILSLPIILIWVGWVRRKALNYIYAVLTCLLGLVVLAGIAIPEFHSVTSRVLTGRLVGTVYALMKGQSSTVDNRQELQTKALRIIRSAPVAGWGPSAYMKNLARIRYVDGDKVSAIETMTSLPLELLANYGIIGGAVGMLALYLIPLLMIFRVRKQIQEREERLAVGIIFVVVCIMIVLFNTNIFIVSQNVNWIYVTYLGFLVSVAFKYNNQLFQIKHRKWMWVLSGMILTIIFIGGTYRTTFGSYGYKMIQQKILSLVSDGYVPGVQTIILDNKELTEPIDMSNTLIATRGNPFRMKYTTNVFRVRASSIPYRVESRDSLVCIKTLVRQRGNRSSFVLRVRVFLNNKEFEHHNFYTDGEKMLFYQLAGHVNQEPEIKVTLYLIKPIPYHEDDRTEVELANYMPSHKDYGDLDIIISVVPYRYR